MPLRLSTVRADDSMVLAVAGEIDMDTVGDLAAAISSIMEDAGVHQLVLDFAEVTFLDATGIAAMLAARRRGRHRQLTLTLINCQRLPLRVLQITGVDKILTGPSGQDL